MLQVILQTEKSARGKCYYVLKSYCFKSSTKLTLKKDQTPAFQLKRE